jgi:PEP-CTERM motif
MSNAGFDESIGFDRRPNSRRRRARNTQMVGSPQEAKVPEPSTRAILILGFAGIGIIAYWRPSPAGFPSNMTGWVQIGATFALRSSQPYAKRLKFLSWKGGRVV